MKYVPYVALIISGITFGAFSYYISGELSLSVRGIAGFATYGLAFVLVAFLFSFTIDKKHHLKATWIFFIVLAIGVIWIRTT